MSDDYAHTDECMDATARWWELFGSKDADRSVSLSRVMRDDPDAVVAWYTCPHRTHRSARKAFVMLVRATPTDAALDVLERITIARHSWGTRRRRGGRRCW